MAGTVITVAQQKGGAGKTTLVTHLALTWAEQGKRVCVLDIDPQGSLGAWYRMREQTLGARRTGIDFAAITGWRATAEIDRRSSFNDIILIDSPPHAETDARIAVRAAHLVLVPIQPSPLDVWATTPTLDLARQEKVPVLLVLNRVPPRANLADAMIDLVKELGAPLAETRLGNRVALAEAIAEGRSLAEIGEHGRAAEEIMALAAEILLKLAARKA
jgi:chromosome partitioning protein